MQEPHYKQGPCMSEANYANMIFYDQFGLPYAVAIILKTLPRNNAMIFFYLDTTKLTLLPCICMHLLGAMPCVRASPPLVGRRTPTVETMSLGRV